MPKIELIHGDCLEKMKDIPDGSVDMILTDPPYGMDFRSNYRKERYDSIKNDSNVDFLEPLIDELHRVMKDNTAGYMFCSFHMVDSFKIAIEERFKLKNILIWEKNNTSMGDLKADYAPKYEMIMYFHKGRRLLEGFRHPNIFRFNRTGNKTHPTEKPVDLCEFLMSNSSKENQSVLDPFMGSGTTGVACVNLNRDFIGIEMDEEYFNIAKTRIEGEIK